MASTKYRDTVTINSLDSTNGIHRARQRGTLNQQMTCHKCKETHVIWQHYGSQHGKCSVITFFVRHACFCMCCPLIISRRSYWHNLQHWSELFISIYRFSAILLWLYKKNVMILHQWLQHLNFWLFVCLVQMIPWARMCAVCNYFLFRQSRVAVILPLGHSNIWSFTRMYSCRVRNYMQT